MAQGASGWKMYVQSNGRPTFYDTTGGEEVSGDSGHVEDGKWSHIAFSCNSGTGVFYINGEESGSSGSMDVADYSDALEIGREGSDNNIGPDGFLIYVLSKEQHFIQLTLIQLIWINL